MCRMALVRTDIGGPFSFEDTNSYPIRAAQDSYLNSLESEDRKFTVIFQDCDISKMGPAQVALTESCVGYQVNFRTVSSVTISQCDGPLLI